MEIQFYVCKKCKKIVQVLGGEGETVSCCGEDMVRLVPGVSDGAVEKHVPVLSVDGLKATVTVGSVQHPMIPEHLIEWICIQTQNGLQYRFLSATDAPKAEFALTQGEEVQAVYAYCNLHGLWKA